jgi:rod shape-determining protein MreC
MIADYRYHRLDSVRAFLSLIVYPIQCTVDAPIRGAGAVVRYATTFHQLVAENADLKQHALEDQAALQKLMALEAENARIRALLQSSPRLDETRRVAEIIQINADPFVHRALVNKGSRQGVVLGQSVIDANGVIGEVIEVLPSTSRVILLTDANYGISVENLRTGIRGIVAGTGSLKTLALQHVANTVDLKVGDTLVTSGLDGRYPSGYVVGRIAEIKHNPSESYINVKITPSAELDRSREVLLVERPKEEH